jgi:hypothetical protein
MDFPSFMNDVVKSYPSSELPVVRDKLNIHKSRSRKTMASAPSLCAFSLHAHACLLDEHDRMFFSILTRQALTQERTTA